MIIIIMIIVIVIMINESILGFGDKRDIISTYIYLSLAGTLLMSTKKSDGGIQSFNNI